MNRSVFRLHLRRTLVAFAFPLGLAVLGLSSRGSAQSTGKSDFDTLCAPCHGRDGTGQERDLIEVNPPDLALLSRKNGGTFPFARVYQTVDGRELKGSHARFAMPFWGEYLQKHGESATSSDTAVKERISAIVRYVETLQK